jgi:hypothetical protein
VLLVYTVTMFASATLLFLVQPMFARMILPQLGGSPAVWNTTVVFYQIILLAGYIYAHFIATRLSRRKQIMLQVALLLASLVALPIAIPAGWSPPTQANPIPWLLALLFVAVSAPFFIVSTSSPLLQSWFASTSHRAAHDPYFLYAASNAGSMLALLSYPLLIEPRLRLSEQSLLWAGSYMLLLLLIVACAAFVWSTPATANRAPHSDADAQPATPHAPLPLTWRRRLHWVLLAAVPSSLMLSVTTYLSTNIVPIPLLWVIPLALYLLTFILVFSGRPLLPHTVMCRALPIVLLPLVIAICAQATQPISLLLLLHLLAFFVITMVCHGALAADRPPARQLTAFYLWVSAGGAIGGMFNALLAPFLFSTVLEYPLALVLACLLLPRAPAGNSRSPMARARWLDIVLPLGLGALVAALILATKAAGMPPGPLNYGLIFGLPALLCFSFSRRPQRFALGIAGLFAASLLYTSDQGQVVYAERSFFGIHRVLLDPTERYHVIAHGGTLHGRQSLDPARRREPLSYYTTSGPIGQVFATGERRRVAVVGLGAGALACYYRAGQEWTFYEIDASVERIARDPAYFTFLRDCTPDASVVLGDARLTLARATEQRYDLIVLDAYSSDSTPIHLITREALALYRDRLAPGGLLAFHISNQYLDLKLVLAALARDAGMVSLYQDDRVISPDEAASGKNASQWMILAPEQADFGALLEDSRWQALDIPSDTAIWTDDFSSVLSVLRLR